MIPLSLSRFVSQLRQHSMRTLSACAALLLVPSTIGSAEELRYHWQTGQKFAYNITITIDENEKTTTYQGMTKYEVLLANAEQLKFTYRGGLPEQVKAKQSNRASSPFGPRGLPFGPRGFPPSPFSRPTFSGRIQTTNQVIMTPTGRVLSMEGDSQLPYLIGNVSLLPFETLPKGDQQQWVVDSGVSISEENENDRPGFGPRGAFGPFGNRENKSVQAATEVTRYNVESTKDNLVSIHKSYQLTSPGGDTESFDMSGAGTWVFDKTDGVPHSLDLSAKLIARDGNSSTTFPITMKYTRVSAAELEKMEAEAKRLAEEAQRKAAEAKALAETPLTESEKKESLADLSKPDSKRALERLKMLEGKSPPESDPDIVAALAKLLKHKDKEVVDATKKALVKWSPEFKRKHDLNKAHEGPGPVGSSERDVESTTPLVAGQIIQFQEHGSFWYAGRVKKVLPNNKVEIESLAWGKPNRELTLARRNLQLAPPELDQPEEVASASVKGSSDGSMRTWTDKSGKFKIEAKFVSEEKGVVKLLRQDGKEAKIPLEKLSDADQAFIREMLEENPFEVK